MGQPPPPSELATYRARLRVASMYVYLGAAAAVLVFIAASGPTPNEPYILALIASGFATAAGVRYLPWERWPPEAFLSVTLTACAQILILTKLGPPFDDLLFFVAFTAGLYYRGWSLVAAIALVAATNLLSTPRLTEVTVVDVTIYAGSALLANQLFASLRDLTELLEEKVARRTAEWQESFDASPAAVLLLDAQGRVRRANAAAVELLGKNAAQLQRRPCHEVLPPQLCLCDDCPLKNPGQAPAATVSQSTDGRWYLVKVTPTSGQGYQWTAQDITEEKGKEETAKAQAQELSLLLGLTDLLNHPWALPELLRAALDHLLTHLATVFPTGAQPRGGIFLLDPAGNELRLTAHRDLTKEFVAAEERVPVGECLCGTAAATGELLTMASVREEGRRLRLRPQPGEGDHGHAVVPLASEERVEGVLFMYFQAGHRFTDEERSFLRSVGSTLGMAIRSARLRELSEHLATHDGLTDLVNHREFHRRLQEEVTRALRYARPLSLLMLDIDHFKQINDTYGHLQGDQVLSELGRILRGNSRSSDMAARYGGEEFTLLLPELGGEEARLAAERLRAAVEGHPFRLNGSPVPVTVSVGVASLGGPVGSAPALLEAADRAMYASKTAGRNRVRATPRR
ncbi:MAG: diguanylate cyclase [Thermaerobacter sp.]|nr:diguanylate cyclase [Thermaerobacter sp.]